MKYTISFINFQFPFMQQEKSDIIFDPNQIFPVPFTLISNVKKCLSSLPIKQPFAYEVYCPISCKKIKIGVTQDQSAKTEAIQFNTTSSRWMSVFVNNDIKYLVNGNNPTKKDKRKANGQNWSIYVQVQDKGNVAIFNPFYIDPLKPLSLYTFSTISKAFKPSKDFEFIKTDQEKIGGKQIRLNNKNFYFYEQRGSSYFCQNNDFTDIGDNLVTIYHPLNESFSLRLPAKQIKNNVNEHLNYWLDQLNEHYILEQTGKSKILEHNIDKIYQNINFYLNIDEQLRIRLLTNKNKELLNSLYDYHPRVYNAFNRLVSFLNYGNTRFDIFKLAELGFFNKTDMLQDLAYIENPHIAIPTAEQSNVQQTQIQLRSRTIPFSRLVRSLPFPNVDFKTCLKSISPQTISKQQIILTEITDPYILFVDKNKKISAWSGRFVAAKLFQIDLLKDNSSNLILHTIITSQSQIKVQKAVAVTGQSADMSILQIGDIFNEQQPKANTQSKPVEIIPDLTMAQQLMNMGYTLNVVKQALINVKNQSVPAALDQIQKLIEQDKNVQKKKPKPKAPWFCSVCTYQNPVKNTICQMCGSQPEIVDEQQLQKQIKEEQQKRKKQQESKKQQERIKTEKQIKELEEQDKKQKQRQEKKLKEQFLKGSDISYIKLFRSQKSSINPFVIVVVFTHRKLEKSMLKVIRIGYNRVLLTQFYRYQNNFFVSNFNRNIYQQEQKSIEPINKVISQSWNQIQVINRLINAYKPDQYFVLQEKQIDFNEMIQKVESDGENISVFAENQVKNYKISVQDNIEKSLFQINQNSNPAQIKKLQSTQVIPKNQVKANDILRAQGKNKLTFNVSANSSSVLVQVVQHVPVGKWKPTPSHNNNFSIDNKNESEVVMSQFLPIMIQNFEGSIFSSKYHSTSLFERNNIYISNYPQANFTFKNINNKNMLAQSVTIISNNKRLQKIYPVSTGLIFTANQLSWFSIAKQKFSNFKREDYQKWLNSRKDRNSYREFWQPVAFFEVETQAQIQIDFKRPAKYLFLLPTGVRVHSEKIEVAALKIDFFGIKGRVQEIDQESLNIYNFKEDCEGYNTLTISGENKGENVVIRKKTGLNTFNYIPKSYDGFNEVNLSLSTVYEIKFRDLTQEKQINIESQYLQQITYSQKNSLFKSEGQKTFQVTSYKSLLQNFNNLSSLQVLDALQTLQIKQFLALILSNCRSFRNFQKVLKIIEEYEHLKAKMFQEMSTMLSQLANENLEVNQYGFKAFLRIFERLSSIDSKRTFTSLSETWNNITEYVRKIRNKNYAVLRNKYEIQQLILEPQLFSKDYYRLIYPNYVQEEPASTIVQEPTTDLNNLYYVEKQNNWYFRTYIDLKQTKKVEKIDIYFPKIVQSANRFKLLIKIFSVNDQSQKLIYHRHFNEQLLVQFATIAFKDKQIYSQSRINYFTVDINAQTRFLRFEYNYLLLTTLNSLRYKQPTQGLTLYPVVKAQNIDSISQKTYQKVQREIQASYPKQTKHSSILESLPPVKYAIDRSYAYYEIYEFPVVNPEIVSKQFSSIIDKITTNIMDKQIVDECIKSMKISQYQFNRKGLDFAYTYLINSLKVFKKMPAQFKIDVNLLIQMFDTFVVYQIGPIMKKVMSFISQVYKRLSPKQKFQFVSQIISTYLTNFNKYKELKQSQKYSLTKVIQKLHQFELPIGLLVSRFSYAYQSNNRFLVSMLLKLIKPNIEKFDLHEQLLKNYESNKEQESAFSLERMIDITFKFNLWVLANVQNLKIELLNQGLDLLLIFMDGKFKFMQTNKIEETKKFINSIDEEDIWKIVFLTLKLKNQELNRKVHEVFQILMSNTTQKFKKSINTMLLEIIQKKQNSTYIKINGQINDDMWMNHLQIILEYLDIQSKKDLEPKVIEQSQKQKMKKKQFSLDIDTAIQLLNLPLTPVLWAHALLIIPREDKVLNSIIKNFKRQYYSSLGKQITKFCQPLAGIRSLESIHVNWLDLVKKIRLQGRSIFSLFVQELRKSNLGGKEGVLMATSQEVKQLQITSEFLKLVLENQLPQKQFNEAIIQEIFAWYFINNTDLKGQSPASQLLRLISENLLKIIQKLSQFPEIVQVCIKCILQIKKDSEKMQGMFQEKRIPTHSALSLNKRFCKCFEDLMLIFVSNDKMSHFFAFQIRGLDYIMQKLNLLKKSSIKESSSACESSLKYLPEQQFLLDEKILSKKIESNTSQIQIKSVEDLKQEQFGNNLKLVANMNQTVSTNSVDWTIYKKGNKTKIIFLPMTDPASYFEFPLYVQLAKIAEVRSIKIGFTCASFQFTDKIVVSPSSVAIEGSLDMKSFEPLGQMTYIDDDGYLCNGVRVFALNLQKVRKNAKIDEAIKGIEVHRVKYLKIVVKRPLVTFIEGQYSQLNGRTYNNVGVSLSFLSVIGDDISKLPNQLVDSCKQISKKTALTLLSNLLTQSNLQTMKKISNQPLFSSKIRQNFNQLKQLMYKYKQIVPQIVYTIGSNNRQLGDWLIEQFIKSGKQQIQAKIINQIIVSTPKQIFERINYFQKQLFKQLALIRTESEVESSLLYNKFVPFMQSFCKTLEECYEIDLNSQEQSQSGKNFVLDCDQQKINYLIDIYDKKYSSPDIKSLLKLLISLIWIRKPLQLSQQVISTTLDLIWRNCSQDKPYFYTIMSALIVSKVSINWIRKNDHEKAKSLIRQIQDSIKKVNYKALKSQMFLLSIISYHQSQYLRSIDYHISIYNSLKAITFTDNQIYDYLMKIQQNVILGHEKQQQKLSTLLISDVSLLVKRKDPILQKLFVGLLAVEQQVMVHLKGVGVLSINSNKNKKIQYVPSKILGRQEQKSLSQKINKKFKYHLNYQSEGLIRVSESQTILSSLYTASSLIIFKIKFDNKIYHTGVYCPMKPTRKEEDLFYWEEQIMADRNCFIFTYSQNDHLYLSGQAGNKLLSFYNCDEQEDHNITIFHNSTQIIRITLNTPSSLQIKGNLIFKNDNNLFIKTQLLNVQIFQCRAIASGASSQSKISQLLSKSNQAKTPFTWYRHNQIYIFPSQISIKKLQKLLSAKLTIQNRNNLPNEEQKLNEIETDDFIIDVNLENPDDYSGEQDFGYIPKTHIFESFSKLGGINEVLRLGSDSIKDWKNANRKKSFQHYMDELKSFIHLPNFFSLFIKNHTYVTFLFEVAAGMPDDTNSTRNWQDQEVNSSRFIYKILSDIFKFDRSKSLRNMDTYEDFCDIILQKLSQISKQAPRVFKEDEIKQQQENLEVASKLEKKKTQDQKRRKKKGTGYGADNQNSSKWSSAEWLQNKKLRSQQILRVVSIFVSFLDCQTPIQDQRVSQVIKSSCLLPLIESALRSSSLLQIAKQIDLFKNYLSIIKNIAKNPATLACLLDIQKNYKPEQTQSIHSLLGKLNNISEIFLECLKSGKQSSDPNNQDTESLAVQIQKTFSYIDKAVKNLQKNKNVLTIKQINDLPIQDAYRYLLENLRFGYIDLKKGAVFQHALHSSISSSAPTTQKILRLSQQLADLSSSLPCQHTNSIFVRCDKSRVDVVKILIMGSKDTPYSNGAFMFDLYCDDSYPNNPPKMVITTTGQGKIRFNPNLYSCGKVCLSLLGTWRGSASENWDPKLSTLLQLVISTQGITMSDDVYFNEPGFDGEQGTQQGQKKNEAYSNIVRLGNVRYAMIDQIKNPPKGFEDVIHRHFYVKRKEIIQECQKWLQYADKRQASYSGLVSDHNSSWCGELKATKTKYKELLQKDVETLKEILNNMQEPDLKQKAEVQVGFNKVQKKRRKAKQVEIEIDVAYDKDTKQELKIEQDVMQDRWSRYIGAMGLEAVKKQSSSNVLLVGLKYLGLQIAKNLVLSGLQKLTIVENQTLDSGSEEHFYMSDLKGKKIQQCIFKIKQLNPYMIVDHKQKIPQSLKQYNLVVSTKSIEQSLLLSEQCRIQSVKFVYSQTCGVSGSYFADFGDKFEINDVNGEEPFEGPIEKISCEKQGVVKLLDGIKHPYQDGDYVVFSKVEGMNIVNQLIQEPSQAQKFYNKMISSQSDKKSEGINGQVFQIKVINWNSFSIGDTTNFGSYVRNGIVKNIKVPKTVKYESFDHCLKQFDKYLDPNMGIYDFEKMGDNFNIFACFLALSKYQSKNKIRPKNWSKQSNKQFAQLVIQIAKECKKSEEQTKSLLQFATKFSLISQAQLPTIGAYLGGLVAQQVIKGLTNKYTPINQFFVFHLNQLVQKIPEQDKWADLEVKKQQPFRNIKIVIGSESMNKLQQMKLFVVGAGAIGCQILKNFAMINIGSKGKITVTDPDHIETSNLTRQFLFRQKHVKKPKSATAAAVLMQMNPNLKNHISARLDKVCQQTEDIYSDEFFKTQSIIANALDNVKARQYMDKRCVSNKIPLFQSGTLGPKGHVQVIVPYKTENYGSQADPNEQAQIPHCTLKMFPEDITHCIQWSRDLFGKVFTLNPKALKKIISSKDTLSIQGKQKSTIFKMIKYRPNSFEDCINEAVRIFFKYFRNDIRQLLYTYPLDMKTKQGKLFWSLPKRPPIQISQLDAKDQVHQAFIASYAVLFAKIFSIDYPKDFRKQEGKQKIMEHAIKVKIQDFVPSAQKSKQIQEMNQKQQGPKLKMSEGNEEPVSQVKQMQVQEQLKLTQDVLKLSIAPQQFQKDEDSNGHIDLIYSMSNLRARNYDLGECKWIDAKLKAGRIMAALSTTTSVVAAIQTLQVIKLISGSQIWRNAFVNLAVPLIQITQPGPAVKQKIGNTQFSVWEDWQFKASTIKDLLNQIRDKYQLQGFNISSGEGTPIFWQTMYKDKQEAAQTLLNKKLSQVIGKDKTALNILFKDTNGYKIYQKVPKIIVQASE